MCNPRNLSRFAAVRPRRVLLDSLAAELIKRGLTADVLGRDGTEMLRVTAYGSRRELLVAAVPTPTGRWAYLWSGGWGPAGDALTAQAIEEEFAS